MRRTFTFYAYLLLILSLALPGVFAQQHIELSNPVGWTIPGLKALSKGSARATTEKKRVDDREVIVSMYVTDRAALVDRLGHLPFLWPIRERQNAFLFQEINVAASKVWVYEFARRRFASIVEGACYVYDQHSKAGGFTNEVRLVFEDRNGDGKYELMLQGVAPEYVPRLPEWAQAPTPGRGAGGKHNHQ